MRKIPDNICRAQFIRRHAERTVEGTNKRSISAYELTRKELLFWWTCMNEAVMRRSVENV